MPTNLFLSEESFQGLPHVLATLEGLRSPGMLTIDLAKISPDANGKKYLKAGAVLVELASGLGAPLKVSKIASAAITSSSTAVVVNDASLFVPGDVLVVAQPYARLDFAATWANADIASLTLDGQAVTHTVADYTTLTALAAAAAATYNASLLGQKATFIAEAQYVHVFGHDTYAIAAGETTAGDGTLAVANSATVLQSNVSVETIAAAGVDVDTNTLTLASTADRRLPVGAPIGVMNNGGDRIKGINISEINLSDLSNDVAVYRSASVYEARLPIWNGYLAAQLPEIITI